jgi:hypothetical protein
VSNALHPYLEALQRRRRQRFAAETRGLGLLMRLDPVLAPVLLLSAVVVLCGWIVVVMVGERYGLFDPDMVRPVRDERKLVNIRDQLASRPFLAAVLHQPERRLYLLQAGGQIHSYDPAIELWSSEQPVVTSGELVTLRSGCGHDPLSHHPECADPDSIWALTDRGGLVRRSAGAWQVKVGDSTFAGDGLQPSNADLTTAALSADGRWLLVGTASSGVGLYWTEQRTWVRLPAEVNESLPSPQLTHIRWWQDRFWCGGPEGLSYVIPDLVSSEAGRYNLIRGPILDLDAGTRLWVLEQQECDNDPAQRCTCLRALTYPDSPPAVLVDERNRFAELDLADLLFAHQNDGNLTVAGKAGLFTYDTRLHSWHRHKTLPILSTYADTSSNIVYAGFNGGVLGLRNNLVAISWQLTDQRIERLQPGRSGEVLAQASSGQIWSLAVNGKVESLLDGSATSLNPAQLTRAVAAGDDLVMVGHQGILVHNIRNRSYRDLGSDQIPPWLRDPNLRLAGSRNAIFGVPKNGGTVLVATVKQLLQGGFEEHQHRLQGPLTMLSEWEGNSLLIISGGQVLELRHGASRPLTGAEQPEMDRLRINDVAVRKDDLVVATDRGVRKYSLNSRSWEPWMGRELGPIPVEEVEVLGSGDRDVVARTSDNRLVRFGQGDRIMVGEAPGFRFAISDRGLSDVMRSRSSLYLGGDGVVAHYDIEGRRMTEQTHLLGARGDVDVVDQVSGQALCLANRRAYLGAQPIDPQAGPVADLFTDESSVWTLRESSTGRYLKAYVRSKQIASSPFRCLFRNPVAMAAGAKVSDAVEIRSGLIVVATTDGLRLYNHAARSWFTIELEGDDLRPMLQGQDLRLRRFGSWLAILNDQQIMLIPTYLMVEQNSCSTRPILIPGEKVQTFQVKAAAVDSSSQNLAWIGHDGAILRWNGDKHEQVRGPHPHGAPDLADLRRVYRSGEQLLLTSDDRIWIYDLPSLSWTEYEFELPDGNDSSFSDINIEESVANNGLTIRTVTAQTLDGAFYIGKMDAIKRVVTLEQLLGPASRRQAFGYPGDSILDIQPLGNYWAFVLDDRIRILDPRSHEWLDKITFAEADPTTTLAHVGWRAVIMRQGGREWWIKRRVELAGEPYAHFSVSRPEQTAIDADGTVWQLQPDGSLHSWSPDSQEDHIEITADSDPVQSLELSGPGARLIALRGNDTQILAKRAWRLPQQGPALNAGWLVWHRDPAQPGLNVRIGNGEVRRLSPAELVQDRQMLFDGIRAVLAPQPNRIYAANRFGVFEHRSNLELDSQLVRFYPVSMGDEISAAHGRFLTPEQSLPAGAGEPQDAYHYHQVRVGKQIVLRESTREQRISGGLLIPQGLPVRFTVGRFPWEQRRGIAFDNTELYLLTGAGVHRPLSGAADLELDPGPNRSALRGGTIRTGRNGGLYYHDGTSWYRRSNRDWLPLTDTGAASAGLLTSSSVTRNGDLVEIVLQDKPSRLTLRLGSYGWEGERLQAATTSNDRLHVMTERAHEIADDIVAFTQDDSERLPVAPTDRLRSFSLEPRQRDAVFRWHAGSLTRWNPETKAFVEAQNPRQGVLLELGRLRFRGEVRGGRLQIVKELRVDSPLGESPTWMPFSFASQGLPIDDVRGIETLESGLFILSGTGASASSYGLQVYLDGNNLSLSNIEAFYDLGGLRSPPRIYRLATDPSRVIVRSGGSCYEWRANFTKLWPCSDETGNDRWLGENDLWQWLERSGKIEGRYKSNGAVTATRVDLESGRFPHDRLRTAMVCNQQTVSLWENGWLTAHSTGDRRDLAVNNSSHLPGPLTDGELLCVDQSIPFEGGEVTAGLHVTNSSHQPFWRIGDDRLEPITDPLAIRELSRLDSAPMVLRAGRLRMGPRHPSLGFRFEYRTNSGAWVPFRWIDGKVSIDQVRHMVADGDNLWAVTPEGLISFERDEESGTARLDPQRLRVIRDIMCDISDIENHQGMLRLRCDRDSSQVYQADLHSDQDAGVFQPMPNDPFAQRRLVSTDYWEWRRTGSGGPSANFIEALFNDEPLGLSGGRFDFDGISSLALLTEDRVDIGTAGGGWYVASDGDLQPGELRRPEVSLIGSFPPQEVMQVGVTWQEGQRLLYVVEADASNALLFSESELVGSSQSWAEHLGADSVWYYGQQGGRLKVTAPGHVGGVARRELVDGRFTDDVVGGAPAAAQDDAGLFYLVPTAAGALRLDTSGRPTGVYALQEGGTEAAQGPEAVLVDEQGRLLALHGNKLLSLDEPGVEVAEVEDLGEPEAIITGIEHGPAETIRIRWRVGRRPGWSLYRRHQNQLLAIGKSTLFADASSWRKFVTGQVAWGNPSPLIEISLQSRQILVSHREHNLAYSVDWPRVLQPMAAVLNQDRLILVEQAGINEVHMGMAVDRIFTEGRSSGRAQ